VVLKLSASDAAPFATLLKPISPTKFFVAANDRRELEYVRAMKPR
jgi:hypothetical protein